MVMKMVMVVVMVAASPGRGWSSLPCAVGISALPRSTYSFWLHGW